jgi:hypothetical protein
MASEGDRRWPIYVARGLAVGVFGLGGCGIVNYVMNRGNAETTIQDAEAATATATIPSGAFGFATGESQVYLPSATPALPTRNPGERCNIINGKPNVFRVALGELGSNYSADAVAVVYDGSGPELDGDPADGSIKLGPKPIRDYRNDEYVHKGDEVCVVSGAQGGLAEATPTPMNAAATSTIEPTSTHTSLDSNNPVNCTNLGLPLDNAITDVCGVGQGGAKQATIICDGTNGQNGFLTVTGYDYDLNSPDNTPAVSVHAQVGPMNQALPRVNFSSSCTDWRSSFPGFMHNNPDLFYPPIPTPAPTETPGTPTSSIERETWSVVRGEQTNKEDAASLHAASVQPKGTLYTDVSVSARRNETVSRNTPRPQIRRDRA